VLLCLTEIKLNYFKDTDTQQDAFHKDWVIEVAASMLANRDHMRSLW
jgi:hypothetical protein